MFQACLRPRPCLASPTPSGWSAPDDYGTSFDEVELAPSYVARRVRDGFGGMQSFGNELTPREISAVATYVTSAGGREVDEPASPASAEAGERVFADHCAGCHPIAGSVPRSQPAWTPTDFRVVWLSARLVEGVLTGRTLPLMGEFMKRLRGRLSGREIRDVAAYVEQTAVRGG